MPEKSTLAAAVASVAEDITKPTTSPKTIAKTKLKVADSQPAQPAEVFMTLGGVEFKLKPFSARVPTSDTDARGFNDSREFFRSFARLLRLIGEAAESDDLAEDTAFMEKAANDPSGAVLSFVKFMSAVTGDSLFDAVVDCLYSCATASLRASDPDLSLERVMTLARTPFNIDLIMIVVVQLGIERNAIDLGNMLELAGSLQKEIMTSVATADKK